MSKLSTPSATEQTRSQLLETRIQEARAELAAVEKEQAELPHSKERLLAAEDLDRKALTSLEERGTQLAKESGYLTTRITLLKGQKEGAASKEADQRLLELQATAERLVEQKATAMAALEAAIKETVERAIELSTLYRKEQDLRGEEVYLVERYRLNRLSIPSLGDPPNIAALVQKITHAFGAEVAYDPTNQWVQKRRQWGEQRRTGNVPAQQL